MFLLTNMKETNIISVLYNIVHLVHDINKESKPYLKMEQQLTYSLLET